MSSSQETLSRLTLSLSEALSENKSATSSPIIQFESFSPVARDTEKAERHLLWKCDVHVIPVLFLMYTLAFLDRINIGNAKIQGLAKELHMTGAQYNLALFIFFVPYIMLEVGRRIHSR